MTREYVTNEGCTVTDHGDEIVLQTKPAEVIDFPKEKDLTWLMHDVCSTPYATVRS